MVASEDVQYFQFDQEGNMFVYKPESGFSGPSVMVEPGFDMKEVTELIQNLSSSCYVSKSTTEVKSDVTEMSQLSTNLSSMDSKIVEPTPVKR